MKYLRILFVLGLLSFAAAPVLHADAAAPEKPVAADVQPGNETRAKASGPRVHTPELMEHLVDGLLERFHADTDQNTPIRYGICAAILVFTFLLRHLVTNIVFSLLGRLAKHTETTLDDELFAALNTPVATLVTVIGGVGALKALKLSESADNALAYAYTVAFCLVVFWLLFRAFNTVLDHMHELAKQKQMGVAAFMPWIKKSAITIFIIFGALLTAQSLGWDVKAFLAGLGIGGLAFALAAQDTIANLFGSVVVAIDQPFKVGETVQIGAHQGVVEDIGLRSTKIRTTAKALVVIPNKTVAAESVTNLSRFTQRRIDQMLGLTYDAKPAQLEAIVEDIRKLITDTDGVEAKSVVVNFVSFGASSLDIQVIYLTITPDFQQHLKIRQEINLKIMKAIEARGLAFAFPTQTVQLDGPIARQLASGRS